MINSTTLVEVFYSCFPTRLLQRYIAAKSFSSAGAREEWANFYRAWAIFTNLVIHGVLGAGPEVLDSSDTEITSLVDYLAIILDFYAFSSDTITKAVANVVRGTLSRIEARSLLVCLKAGK